jgi:tRNA-dependent cyclodipeptide synthase
MLSSQRRDLHQVIGSVGTYQEHSKKESRTNISIIKTTGLGYRVATEKKQHNGFMLISVDTPYYSKPVIIDYCEWALENLDKFLLVIVDMPQMYNYWVRRNMLLEHARSKAEQVGQERKKSLEKVIRNLGTERISVVGFNELAQERRYETTRGIIARYFIENALFEHDVLTEVSKHVRGAERGRELANFFIDEVAALLYLSELGNYPIEIAHQDEFDVVKNIYAGKYTTLANELELRGNVGYIQTVKN